MCNVYTVIRSSESPAGQKGAHGMTLTSRQRYFYELGIKMAKDYEDEKMACYALDSKDLEDMAMGRWSNQFWFHAGFSGYEPEYVSAIRYGKAPEGGRSTNWAEHSYENGVSCIKIIRSEEDKNYASIYDAIYGMQGVQKITVNGWYLGTAGSDGEPLLIDVI